MSDRAKQFMPFSALGGFGELLREKEKIKSEKRELSFEMEKELSDKISLIKKGDIVFLEYFENGEYFSLEGIVTKIDFTFKTLTIVKKELHFEDILEIAIK
ncbi:MAG: YolD-like family protein [Clostridia bacterium]|nr:YolD-like family protein [Clostridia bacterium]